ncbi:putative ATP-grasp-modified RiPP [Cryptosporangium phraense]|uniref:Putative ATP-grasp-modified RiPP n=1 Tax=Cryptosporangium phraense TaxID=2593070 RepID=A0A545AMA0_9ACTN|nr:putative ATP-grasp-modified RiPP [Cryptosporangium phraense]TQS42448.1 putative ATP-grasp-modified RiPP [Cryptosporangium phraense]
MLIGSPDGARNLEETVNQQAAYAAVFPISDQLPLGRAALAALRSGEVLGSDGVKTGHDPDERPVEGAARPVEGAVRPFGLRFATLPRNGVELPLEAISYDDDAQVALARDGAGWTPLTEHSMGLTLRTTGQIPREDEIHDKSS